MSDDGKKLFDSSGRNTYNEEDEQNDSDISTNEPISGDSIEPIDSPDTTTDDTEDEGNNKQKKSLVEKYNEGMAKAKKIQTIVAWLSNPTVLITVSVILGIFAVFILVVLIISASTGGGLDESGQGYNNYTYVAGTCTSITITGTGSNDGTYSMEEYIEGVVAAEFSLAERRAPDKERALEAYKAFSIIARTYAAFITQNGNCTLTPSSNNQNFDPSNVTELIKEAVKITKGVIIVKNKKLEKLEYDAFCWKSKDASKYVLEQKDLSIPTSWVEKNVTTERYKTCKCNEPKGMPEVCFDSDGDYKDGGHGRGLSQYGLIYLINENGYLYDAALRYFYGDDIDYRSIYQVFTSGGTGNGTIVGDYILETSTNKHTILNESLDSFLKKNGSSAEEFNTELQSRIQQAGLGTREAVVTAALYVTAGLGQTYGVKIPYFYGGGWSERSKYGSIPFTYFEDLGVNPNYGTSTNAAKGSNGEIYYYYGWDCSGFVAWALYNGGFQKTLRSANSYKSYVRNNGGGIYDMSLQNVIEGKIGQIGDLMHHDGHIMLIVHVDRNNQKYYLAQAMGGKWGTVISTKNFEDKDNVILDMSFLYDSPSNLR